MADDRLIVALDVSTMDAVKEIVLSLGDSVSFYKVGMELFYAEGAKTIRFLQEQNKQIFLDFEIARHSKHRSPWSFFLNTSRR